MKPWVAAAFWVAATGAAGQQPPAPGADTVAVAPVALDSVPDSLRVHLLPTVDGRGPVGAAVGVWRFGREELLAMHGLSLSDLLAEVPGVTRLRGGDYGALETVTAFGLAGGGVRVFWDGFEHIPLDGSVVDLSLIGLGGVQEVRVERHPGELRIHLDGLRDTDPRPQSLIEAGTGDYDTNFFRGTFTHPRALGGSFGVALDRVDTNGPGGDEHGARTGGWMRYHRFFSGDRVALTAEARRMKAGVDVASLPGEGTQLDWVVRGRWRPVPALGLQGFTGQTSLSGLAETGRLDVDRSRRQHGLVADAVFGPARGQASLRFLDGPAVPSRALDLSGTAERPELGGATAAFSSESWGDDVATLTRVSGWTRPFFGLSLFAGWESGERGVPIWPRASEEPEEPAEGEEPEPAEPEPDPEHALVERTATRLGVRFAWRGIDLTAARLGLEADALPLLGLPMDRDGVVLPGIERTGLEVAGRIPLPLLPEGFALTGALTQWDAGARYLPERAYQAAVGVHNQYKAGNLEVWGSIGVEGRGPMAVPLAHPSFPEPAEGELPVLVEVPFYQSWKALIQVRVLTVRLFVAWENLTVRRNNQDFPDRVLPIFRAHYGVRWTLWN